MSFEDKQHVCSDCYVIATRMERERILNLCRDLHIEKNQRAHIEKPSGVCNTCRAVALIKGENK